MALLRPFPFLPPPAFNSSLLHDMSPSDPLAYPFYRSDKQSLIPGLSDRYTALAVPIIVYWFLGALFHLLDVLQLPYFEARRIHESAEVTRRNRVTLPQLIKAVVFQHVVQTAVGLLWIQPDSVVLPREVYTDHALVMSSKYAPRLAQVVPLLIGTKNGEAILQACGKQLVEFTYWWGVPAAQFFLAFFVIDTWQFFLHKAMHEVPYLYRNFHSHHHRLYVPYAFGALYNHPVEGFLLDSVGAALAEAVAGMTVRQTILLFGFSSAKTVDDHSGYRIWWDPMQLLFANNADYHDIHHQSFGIKKNFSQPFFTRWDVIFNTVMTRDEANAYSKKRPVGSSVETEILEIEAKYHLTGDKMLHVE